MIPEGQSFPLPPFALFKWKRTTNAKKNEMKWTIATSLIIQPKIKYVKNEPT
jgi:hypothetical protein